MEKHDTSHANFHGKIALVTGAGRGLGRAIAEAFARQGAAVAVNDLNPSSAAETVRRITAAGGRAREYVADISRKMPIQGIIHQLEDDFGGLDILVNNAGVSPQKALLDMDEWDWRRTVDVNLTGPFLLMQVAGRVMRAQGRGGAIVNIGAAADSLSHLAHRAAYAASKAGLLSLTRTAARELAPHQIRVNAVCPGVIDTESTAVQLENDPTLQDWLRSVPPVRMGQPEEVAALTLYLCSPAASYINGQTLEVGIGY